MMSSTHRQKDLLEFIGAYIAANDGVAPTFEEMADHLGLGSKSGVHRLLTGLETRGLIRRYRRISRCIEVIVPMAQRPREEIAEQIIAMVRYEPKKSDDRDLIRSIASLIA